MNTYAVVKKIPCEYSVPWSTDRTRKYYHWEILATYEDERIAHEQINVWSNVLRWYNRQDLEIKEVPGHIESGDVLNLYAQTLVKAGLDNGWGEPGTFAAYPRTDKLPDPSIRVKFEKKGSTLLCDGFTIEKNGDVVNVWYGKKESRALLACVDGYAQTKAIMRAKREVQYLIDEPDERENRITIARYPIITPEGIVMSWVNRPEVPLLECDTQVQAVA